MTVHKRTDPQDAHEPRGVLPSQGLRQAVEEGWISSGDYRIRPESIQPASIDLRLADHAWALRCSFLPSAGTQVMDRVEDLALDRLDLRDGATLERDRPYLIPLVENLALPPTSVPRRTPRAPQAASMSSRASSPTATTASTRYPPAMRASSTSRWSPARSPSACSHC